MGAAWRAVDDVSEETESAAACGAREIFFFEGMGG